MGKHKKIPISEFISEKKLNKIEKMITNSDDVELNYDRIENLLSDDYEVKDLGTNRIVLIHNKKKYKDYVFKVAGDSHGIEANYREFYNGDIDKHLTFSYSISSNGVFVVQERVQRMKFDDMKEHKKEVREMLHKLSKKILLVDCKLSNFKNFGIRKNGEVCLLDHGDTIPLPKFQDNNIVNIEEESCVSLRCKKPDDISGNQKKLKPCGGKLKYSKNFDSLICTKCGAISSVNDAYREFYGDRRVKLKGSSLDLGDFDIDAWKEKIKNDMKQYCVETMSHANNNNNNNNNNEGDFDMKTIDGVKVTKVKGYWIPEPSNSMYIMNYNSVKMGSMKPKDYLKLLGIKDTNKYKVTNEDILGEVSDDLKDKVSEIAKEVLEYAKEQKKDEVVIPYNYIQTDITIDKKVANIIREIINAEAGVTCIYTNEGFSLRFRNNNKPVVQEKPNTKVDEDYANEIANKVIANAINNNKYETLVPYDTFDDISYMNDRPLINRIREIVNSDSRSAGCIYNKNGFSVRIKNEFLKDDRKYTPKKEEHQIDEKTFSNDIPKHHTSVPNNDNDNIDDYIKKYIEENPETKIINEKEYEEKPIYTNNSILTLSKSDIDNARVTYHDRECAIIGKYAIPIDVIVQYENEDGDYDLPKKMKTLLKAHNLSPKKYKLNSDTISEKQIEISKLPTYASDTWTKIFADIHHMCISEGKRYINIYPLDIIKSLDAYSEVIIGKDLLNNDEQAMTDKQVELLASVISSVIENRRYYVNDFDDRLATPAISYNDTSCHGMTVLIFEDTDYCTTDTESEEDFLEEEELNNERSLDDINEEYESENFNEDHDRDAIDDNFETLENDSDNNTSNIGLTTMDESLVEDGSNSDNQEEETDLNSTELVNALKELSEKIEANNDLLKDCLSTDIASEPDRNMDEELRMENDQLKVKLDVLNSKLSNYENMVPNTIVPQPEEHSDFVVIKLHDLKNKILVIEEDNEHGSNLVAMDLTHLISEIDNPSRKDVNVTGLITNEL